MIDLHAHILPGIDDGPRNLDGSVALARAAVAEGTRVLAATSHIDHSFGLTPADLAPRLEAVRDRLAEEGIPLEVVAGGEISIARLPELHDEDLMALRLGGGPTLLVEAPLMPFAGDLEGLVFALQVRRHRVLLAHPERSPLFLRRPERLATLVNQGVLVQITAGSLLAEVAEQRARPALHDPPARGRARPRDRVRRTRRRPPPARRARRVRDRRVRPPRRRPARVVDGGGGPRGGARGRPGAGAPGAPARAQPAAAPADQASLRIAMTMPASTNSTIRACTHNQKGDTPPA